jgi:hypothetical protein
MFFVPLAIMEGCDITTNAFIGRNLIPVTFGNIIGGMLYISVQYLIYHPYIAEENISLKQGGKHAPFSRSASTDGHQIPGHENSMFHSAHFWFLSHMGTKGGNDTAPSVQGNGSNVKSLGIDELPTHSEDL